MQTAACVVTPNASDAGHAVRFLRESGIEARAYDSLPSLARVLDDSTGCLILVDDALLEHDIPALQEALARLPAWSDLPLIIVSHNVAALGPFIANAFPTSGNVTYLERPLNPHSLVSAAQMALRAASRQRQTPARGSVIAPTVSGASRKRPSSFFTYRPPQPPHSGCAGSLRPFGRK